MKKIFSALMLAVLACSLLSSCNDSQEDPDKKNNYYPHIALVTDGLAGETKLTTEQKNTLQETIKAVNAKFHNGKYFVSAETGETILCYVSNNLIAPAIQEELIQSPIMSDAKFCLSIAYTNGKYIAGNMEYCLYFTNGKYEKPEYYPQLAFATGTPAGDAELSAEQKVLIQTNIDQHNRIFVNSTSRIARQQAVYNMKSSQTPPIVNDIEDFLKSNETVAKATFTLVFYYTDGNPSTTPISRTLKFKAGKYTGE
ncbi:MAG: hypothetical protein HUK14_09100 [Muribaculaceae bacterium]|nr:hypothetical protein [Muribaculaceae bacterium]